MRESFRSIPDRFGAIVARLPDATAIIGEGVSFTYRQLDLLSDRLADGLMSWGVKPGEPVVLVLPRSPAAVIAMLAALKAGAYYVPLDPSAPDQVLADYLSELQVSCVVVPHGCVRHFAAGLQVHAIGPDGAPGAVEVVRPRLSKQYAGKASLESPAYAMFTSGSTGKPKGVLIPHRAVLRLVVEPDYIKISCEDRVLHAAPITFDASTFEIWAPLLNGAVLVVYESGVLDLNAMQELASTAGVTVMWLTAALFHLVVRSFMSLLTGVRVLLAGGDVLRADAVAQVFAVFPSITVVNGYGPTENTTFTCCHVMRAANAPSKSVPIGRAIRGTTVDILDSNRRRVATGTIGELYAGGLGLALGYLNAPDRNRVAFVEDPSRPGQMLYRTGDLAREIAPGVYDFVGRVDNQIKIRGYRLCVEEIQAELARMGEIEEAIIYVATDDLGEKHLVAMVQSVGNPSEVAAGAKRYLAQRMPAYMIPEVVRVYVTLPVNVNGKVDRRHSIGQASIISSGDK